MIGTMRTRVAAWYRGRRWFRWLVDVLVVAALFSLIAAIHSAFFIPLLQFLQSTL